MILHNAANIEVTYWVHIFANELAEVIQPDNSHVYIWDSISDEISVHDVIPTISGNHEVAYVFELNGV